MNKICKWIILLAPVFCVLTAGARGTDGMKERKEKTVKLYGEVYDSFTKGTVSARIVLMTADSTVVKEDSTNVYNTYSTFGIEVPKRDEKYIFKLEADGYETTFANYELTVMGRKQYYLLPRMLMKRKATDIYKDVELDGVVVKGTKIQVAYKGDTIVYDASAFNLPEGSMLDALVRQLPGAELKDNGDIYVNGEKIDNLTLNGADFFKGDNKVMLENLPYFTVKNVQVYHKESEMSRVLGDKMAPKEYVMDVKLKREYSRGYIVNAEAGAGTEDRYMSRLFGSYFDDHTRLSLFANANNVNENIYPGQEGDWTPASMPRNVTAYKKTGVQLHKEDKDKKVSERLWAALNVSDRDAVTKRYTETFATDGNILSWNNSNLNTKNLDFTARNQLSFVDINLFTVLGFNYVSGKSDGKTDDDTERNGEQVNSRMTQTHGKNKRIGFNYTIAWSRPLKSGDSFFANFYGNFSNTKPVDYFSMEHTSYAATGENEFRNRYTDRHGNSYGYHVDVGYVYSLPDSWNLKAYLNYGQTRNMSTNFLYRLDRLDDEIYDHLGTIPVSEEDRMVAFDMENSEKSTIMKREYSARLSLGKRTRDIYFSLDLPLTHIREKMNYMQSTLDTLARRSYTVFQPVFSYRTFGRNSVNLNYSLNVDRPEFKELMPVINTSDKLNQYVSNPDLANTIAHRAGISFAFKNEKTGGSANVGVDAMVKFDGVGTRTTYNPLTGGYTYKDENVDGNWWTTLKGGVDYPLDKDKRLRIGVDGSVKYEHNVNFAVAYDEADAVLSKVDNVYTRLNTKLTYRFKTLSAGVVAKLTYRHSTGNQDRFETIDVYDYQYGGNLQYTIPLLKLNVSTDLNMFSRRGYSSSMMNTDDLIWNAQISRSFAKGCITAKIKAFDLLHNLSNVRYSMNGQGRTETWYNSIPRYVMFSLAYSFKQKPNKNK